MKVHSLNSDDIHETYCLGKEAAGDMVLNLFEIINELMVIAQKHGKTSQSSQNKISTNSWSNSQPLSSDGFKKRRRAVSLRKSEQKSNEVRKERQGQALKQAERPHIEVHTIKKHADYRASMENIKLVEYEKPQVFDILPAHIHIVKQRVETQGYRIWNQ